MKSFKEIRKLWDDGKFDGPDYYVVKQHHPENVWLLIEDGIDEPNTEVVAAWELSPQISRDLIPMIIIVIYRNGVFYAGEFDGESAIDNRYMTGTDTLQVTMYGKVSGIRNKTALGS